MITKIKAINACLSGVGIAPVNDEESGPDASSANEAVDLASTALQTIGWWFNTEYNYKLTPNSVGEIQVADNIIKAISWNTSYYTELSLRGNRVYDLFNHTYDLSDAVNTDGSIDFVFIFELEFEELPASARLAIQYAAKRLYAQDQEADITTFQMQSADENNGLRELYRENSKQNKRNVFMNPYIAGNVSLASGPNAYFQNSQIFPRRNN